MGALARGRPTLTTDAERAAARDLAARDPRLGQALRDVNGFGFAQTLAGAHQQLDHYRSADEPVRLLLEGAADARRLGHTHALTVDLLHALALALWCDTHGPTSLPDPDWGSGWFSDALRTAAEPLPDTARESKAINGHGVRA